MNHLIKAIAVVPFAFGLAIAAPAAEATVTRTPDPQPTGLRVDQWPDEGSGYPGYADQVTPPGSQPTDVNQASALHITSIALGGLGGIALSGAALGFTLILQHRRDHRLAPTQGV
jgi:hypothetical protein